MASISTLEAKIAIGMGAAWGTARDLTTANVGRILNVTSWDDTAAFGQFDPPDTGFDNFFTGSTNLELKVSVSGGGSFTFDGPWIQVLAAFMGAATASPAETTAGQGDYPHVLDMTSSLIGRFITASRLIEDDYALESPSIKITSFKIGSSVNGVGTWSFTGLADRQIPTTSTPTNTAAEIVALAVSTYNPQALGGANHYFRMNNQTAGALSNANDLPIMEWNLDLTRPFQERYELRGVNSKFTQEPFQAGQNVGQLSFKLSKIDDSVVDIMPDYFAGTEKKAELFIDGSQIGTGVNRSMKVQFPRLYPLPPSGLNIPSGNSLMQPTLNYRVLAAAAAPTGMTGVTKYNRFTFINQRIQSYFN